MAAATATEADVGGQNLDLALIMADGSEHGRADPAHAAHVQPIGHWAMAVWHAWLPIHDLYSLAAKGVTKLVNAARPWHNVRGPGTAVVASCARIGWKLRDAAALVTDRGNILRLDLDSPQVVKAAVCESVKRWRWKRVELHIPQLQIRGAGVGGDMAAVWKPSIAKTAPSFRAANKKLPFGRSSPTRNGPRPGCSKQDWRNTRNVWRGILPK